MSAHEVVDFCDARMRLRASRAAIVFPGDEGWHDWARLALYTASQLWGGKGFVLVPHTGGDVDPMVLRAVTAYDPDYVVQLQVTLSEYEALRPGALSISSAGRVLAGAGGGVDEHGVTLPYRSWSEPPYSWIRSPAQWNRAFRGSGCS